MKIIFNGGSLDKQSCECNSHFGQMVEILGKKKEIYKYDSDTKHYTLLTT